MTNLTTLRDIKRQLIKAELDAYLSTGNPESLHGVRDACTDLEVIEARLEERAGRIEPVPAPMCTICYQQDHETREHHFG